MSFLSNTSANRRAPEFLVIGHVTLDEQLDGRKTLGGTASYAALTATRLGLTAGIVTSLSARDREFVLDQLPQIQVAVRPSGQSTVFRNRYRGTTRTQWLLDRAAPLTASDVPEEWRSAPIALLAPVADELDISLAHLFSGRPGITLAATPQGWLRSWDQDGRISPCAWKQAELVTPHLDALILSCDDLGHLTAEAEKQAILQSWSDITPAVVATVGAGGAFLYQSGIARRFPAFPADEIDPTGAGDVFAAAFLARLFRGGTLQEAMVFANCAASFVVEKKGVAGIPTHDQVMNRLVQAAKLECAAV